MAHPIRQRRLRNWIGLCLLPLVLFMILRWFEYSQVYHPTSTIEVTPAHLGRPFEEVSFSTPDGETLHAWFFPSATHTSRARDVFLICHGNGGNISHRLALYEILLQTGAAVFAFDYRGYGQSTGRPGEEGTYRDAQSAFQWLRQKGFAPKNIIAYGESLGGGVASELALRETIGGLVLQSTFTSAPDVGAELFPWLPVRWVSRIKYNTRAKLPRIHAPILIVHSRHDSLVRFHHAEENFAAANEPKLLLETQGDHNDGITDPSHFLEGMNRFLDQTRAQ